LQVKRASARADNIVGLERLVPVPTDIHLRVMSRRFQQRRLVAAGSLAVALIVICYLLWAFLQTTGPSPLGLRQEEQALLGLMVLAAVAAVEYVCYRCPNCNSRPLGKNWLGVNPTRCPACKMRLQS
jgi:hypothetical protein